MQFLSPDENHLLLELSIGVRLRADLEVEMNELLELLVPGAHHIHDDGHKERIQGITIEHRKDDLSHGLDFDLVRALFDPLAQSLEPDLLIGIRLVDDGIASICGAHDGQCVWGLRKWKREQEG
jgi:hypothetical protein